MGFIRNIRTDPRHFFGISKTYSQKHILADLKERSETGTYPVYEFQYATGHAEEGGNYNLLIGDDIPKKAILRPLGIEGEDATTCSIHPVDSKLWLVPPSIFAKYVPDYKDRLIEDVAAKLSKVLPEDKAYKVVGSEDGKLRVIAPSAMTAEGFVGIGGDTSLVTHINLVKLKIPEIKVLKALDLDDSHLEHVRAQKRSADRDLRENVANMLEQALQPYTQKTASKDAAPPVKVSYRSNAAKGRGYYQFYSTSPIPREAIPAIIGMTEVEKRKITYDEKMGVAEWHVPPDIFKRALLGVQTSSRELLTGQLRLKMAAPEGSDKIGHERSRVVGMEDGKYVVHVDSRVSRNTLLLPGEDKKLIGYNRLFFAFVPEDVVLRHLGHGVTHSL